MPEFKLEILYDGVWVEDITIEAETDFDAHAKAKEQAMDNLEVRHKK